MKGSFSAVEPAVSVLAWAKPGDTSILRAGETPVDERQRGRVTRPLHPQFDDFTLWEIAARRACERDDLQNARIRPEHGPQREARRSLAGLIEALLPPPDLDISLVPDVAGEGRQQLHQIAATDYDPRMPSVPDDVERLQRLARRCLAMNRLRRAAFQEEQKREERGEAHFFLFSDRALAMDPRLSRPWRAASR